MKTNLKGRGVQWKVIEGVVGTRMQYKEWGHPWKAVEVVEGSSQDPRVIALTVQMPGGDLKYLYVAAGAVQKSRGKEWILNTSNGVLRERRPDYQDGVNGLGHMAVQVHAQGPLDRNRYQASVLQPASQRHKNQTGEDVVTMANGGFATPQEAHLWLSTWARQHPEATDFIIYDRKASRMVYAHTTRRGHGRSIPRGSFQGLGCASCGVSGLGDIGKQTDAVASEGSVISGTMLDRDLIPAFLAELATLDPERAESIENDPDNADILADPDGHENATDLTAELFDILNEYSPPGCSFGSHPGDGSDYGWWCEDERDEDDL